MTPICVIIQDYINIRLNYKAFHQHFRALREHMSLFISLQARKATSILQHHLRLHPKTPKIHPLHPCQQEMTPPAKTRRRVVFSRSFSTRGRIWLAIRSFILGSQMLHLTHQLLAITFWNTGFLHRLIAVGINIVLLKLDWGSCSWNTGVNTLSYSHGAGITGRPHMI